MNLDATRNPYSEGTTRETTRQVGVRRKKQSDYEERRCKSIQICVHETFTFGPRQIRFCRDCEAFGPGMSELRDFDFISQKRAARYLVGKPKVAL